MTKLKCWRRRGNNAWRDKNQNLIAIRKSSLIKGKRWAVVDEDKRLNNFKTKPQALKFAKSYMKKHDKC